MKEKNLHLFGYNEINDFIPKAQRKESYTLKELLELQKTITHIIENNLEFNCEEKETKIEKQER